MPFIDISVSHSKPNSPSAFLEAFTLGLMDIIKHECASHPNRFSATLEKIARNNPLVDQSSLTSTTYEASKNASLIQYPALLSAIMAYQLRKHVSSERPAKKDTNPVYILQNLIPDTILHVTYLDEIQEILNKDYRSSANTGEITSETKNDEKYQALLQSKLYTTYQQIMLTEFVIQQGSIKMDQTYFDKHNIDPVITNSIANEVYYKAFPKTIPSAGIHNNNTPQECCESAIKLLSTNKDQIERAFCQDLFGSSAFLDQRFDDIQQNSALLKELRRKTFSRADAQLLAKYLDIELQITSPSSKSSKLNLLAHKPLMRLLPPTTDCKEWHTRLTIAPSTSRPDLCERFMLDSILTTQEIINIIQSIYSGFSVYFFGSQNKKNVHSLIKKLQLDIQVENSQSPMSVHKIIEKVTTYMNNPLLQKDSEAQEVLSYLVIRHGFVNAHRERITPTTEEHSSSTTEKKVNLQQPDTEQQSLSL